MHFSKCSPIDSAQLVELGTQCVHWLVSVQFAMPPLSTKGY